MNSAIDFGLKFCSYENACEQAKKATVQGTKYPLISAHCVSTTDLKRLNKYIGEEALYNPFISLFHLASNSTIE